MADITIPGAFLAGTISFLSPCVLPLVPPYLIYLAGADLGRLQVEGERPRTGAALAAAAVFVLGFSTVFIALGAGASVVGAMLRAYSTTLSMIAGFAILAMGLHFLGVARIPLLLRQARLEASRPSSFAGAYIMGLAFAFGWTPCIGPVLAAILAVAGAEETLEKGAGLLAVYSAGLGVPFLVAAAFVEPFLKFASRFKRHLQTVERVMGALLVATGIAFLFGWVADAAFLLLETFPALGRLG